MRDAVLMFQLEIHARPLRVALCCAGLLLSGVAYTRSARSQELAQEPARGSTSTEVSREAQAHFERGVAAFEEGRFRDAVELFKEADRLAPSALLSFNAAKVYERMGDNRNALASYREYLRRLPSAENRTDVSGRIAELETSLAKLGVQQLTVLSTPGGATVLIGEESRGVTPWTGELPPGPHHLALRLRGYQDAAVDVKLPAERAIDVTVELLAAPSAVPSPGAAAPAAAPAVIEPSRGEPIASTPAPLSAGVDVTPAPNWWTWALFGASAASFAGAVGFELSRSNLEEDARQTELQIDRRDKLDRAEGPQTAARVFLGVGIAAALAGGVSLYLDLDSRESLGTGVAMACDVAGCALSAGGSF